MLLRVGGVFAFALFFTTSVLYGDHEIGYTEMFSPDENYTAEWCATEDVLHFRLTADVRGWVAVGFSDDQFMANSDIVMATGEGAIQDSWAVARAAPPPDASQDATLHSSSQVDRTTVVEFSRPRVTGDDRDLSLDQERFIVWATNASSDRFNSRHSGRGFTDTRIDFAAAGTCIVVDPTDRLDDGSLTDPVERQAYVHDVLGTWIGDSNLDGEFNTTDLVAVFAAGLFETGMPAVWATGDWNGDMEFGTGDLVYSFSDGGFEQGPRPAAAVPEPSSCLLLLLGGWALAYLRHRTCGREMPLK